MILGEDWVTRVDLLDPLLKSFMYRIIPEDVGALFSKDVFIHGQDQVDQAMSLKLVITWW
jgi:hypothetical protein